MGHIVHAAHHKSEDEHKDRPLPDLACHHRGDASSMVSAIDDQGCEQSEDRPGSPDRRCSAEQIRQDESEDAAGREDDEESGRPVQIADFRPELTDRIVDQWKDREYR